MDLVNRDANQLQPWLGRGLGGIGAPLFRTTGLVITGDNMFVSLYVTFGILCAAFALPVVGGYSVLLRKDIDAAFSVFGISCALLIMATTNVTIEAPYLCFCFGLVCGKFFDERNYKERRSVSAVSTGAAYPGRTGRQFYSPGRPRSS